MSRSTPSFPERLLVEQSRSGDLIKRALEEPQQVPSELQSFDALLQRRKRPSPWRPLGYALAVSGALALVVFQLFGAQAAAPSVNAEALVSRPRFTPVAQPAPVEVPAAVAPREEPALRPNLSKAPLAKPKPATVSAATPPASPCAELARDGKYDEAAACYGTQARGDGMASELALYEKARIEAKALNRAGDALATLEQYAQRFPHGVLATEASITRIELLIRGGQSDAALSAIERALSAAGGREREGDLQAWRAELLAARNDCTAARSALERARALGVHASRLANADKRCPAESDSP
ncbi:MAG: hypothetical protein QM756_15515 [Polyangiaceae bacterium]